MLRGNIILVVLIWKFHFEGKYHLDGKFDFYGMYGMYLFWEETLMNSEIIVIASRLNKLEALQISTGMRDLWAPELRLSAFAPNAVEPPS